MGGGGGAASSPGLTQSVSSKSVSRSQPPRWRGVCGGVNVCCSGLLALLLVVLVVVGGGSSGFVVFGVVGFCVTVVVFC